MHKSHKVLLITVLYLFSLSLSPGYLFAADTAKQVGDWLGGRAKLAWLQDQGKGTDTLARGNDLRLYGYDTEDGEGERQLTSFKGNLFKPLIAPDGESVIISDRKKREIYQVEWKSGKVQKLGPGVAVAIWTDPNPSFFLRKTITWVYCFDGLQPENKYGSAQPLKRFALSNPKKRELVWKKTNLAWSNIQLSRDGELIGGLFPWPDGGVLWADEKRWERLGRGCWTSLSPDNSKLLWIFDGQHRNLQIHDVKGRKNWKVKINGAPGVDGYEVYHPRWSNHPRYFVMTGPYKKGEGSNKVGGGGEKVEIYIGRFNQSATGVEAWQQATVNVRADFYPDLWIEGGEAVNLKDSGIIAAPTARIDDWPTNKKNLIFVWENMKAANQLAEESPVGFYQCNIDLRGRAVHTRSYQLETRKGWAETGDAAEKIVSALARSGKGTIEFVVTSNDKQEGTLLAFRHGGANQLVIKQQGNAIILGTKADATLARWPNVLGSEKPIHFLLLLNSGKADLLVDGRSMGEKSVAIDFKNLSADSFVLGDVAGAWQGTIEGVAVYNTVLNDDDLAKHAKYAPKRSVAKPVPQLVLEASLTETTEIPAPDSIGAYSRALVVNVYSIKEVLSGEYQEKRILVAEWAVMDRKIVKDYDNSPQQETLIVEKFDDHPELEGERQMMDLFEPDLEMYYRLNE